MLCFAILALHHNFSTDGKTCCLQQLFIFSVSREEARSGLLAFHLPDTLFSEMEIYTEEHTL